MNSNDLDALARRIIERANEPWYIKIIDRMPGWPSERQWISLAVITMILVMFQMAVDNPELWKVELFKLLLSTLLVTGFVNMILGLHFSADKNAETKAENTGKMADAMKEVAKSAGAVSGVEATNAANEVADAATGKAKEISEE